MTVSSGLWEVIRTTARHSAQAIAAVMPGTPSFVRPHLVTLRQDLAAGDAIGDGTALLRLELEGTISELTDSRVASASAADGVVRARAGRAIGEAARRALLLNDALASAAGRSGSSGPTAIDTAVEARAADIARLNEIAATETATRTALGDDVDDAPPRGGEVISGRGRS